MTPFDFVLFLLVTVGIHRLWLYEEIFESTVKRLRKASFPWNKMLTCPPCFAFWAAVVAWGLVWGTSHNALTWPLAAYPIIRGAVWLYGHKPQPPAADTTRRTLQEVVQSKVAELKGEKPEEGCSSCGEKKTGRKQMLARLNAPQLVIVTTLTDLHPSYSLTSVIKMHIEAALHQGWHVTVVVQESFQADLGMLQDHPMLTFAKVMPNFSWIEDEINEPAIPRIQEAVRSVLRPHRGGLVICHDLLFQSWFLTHAKALHLLEWPTGWDIYHIAHSTVGGTRFTDHRQYRCSVPPGHKLISLNYSDAQRMASFYQADPPTVLPNGLDIGAFTNMHPLARQIIIDHDLERADVVQVYPLSILRWGAKGLHDVLAIFAEMKRMGLEVRLVLADAHNVGSQAQEAVGALRKFFEESPLTEKEVIFGSDYLPKESKGVGLPREVIAGLFSVSNLFIFPSRSEASPLVLLEAAASGCLLVLNTSLQSLSDIIPHQHAVWVPFGTVETGPKPQDLSEVAERIVSSLESDKTLHSKRRVLRNHGFAATAERIAALMPQNKSGLAKRVNGDTV